MCGIAGWLATEGRSIPPAALAAMTDAIAHRGPDDEGSYRRDYDAPGVQIALGHRRLSIIDLATGHQPMVDPQTGSVVVFNGEIYNFRTLREELAGAGHHFGTSSDTEVLLVGYRAWGTAVVSRLSGMFAFALWDPERRRLLLARDRFGEKPLFVLRRDGCLYFASEIKALLAVPGVHAEVDQRQLHNYLLYRYAPGPRTLLQGIEKLAAGCLMVASAERTEVTRYYDLPDRSARRVRGASRDPASDLLGTFEEAVRARMVSDVPFGAFLSGGIDSSAVVAMMARASSQPVRTYSVGFREETVSELGYARLVADRFGTVHRELIISGDDIEANIARCTFHRDAPVSEPADIPIFLLSKAARHEVKMVLTGEGADEVLGGYPKHRAEAHAGPLLALPAPVRRAVFGSISRLLPSPFGRAAIALAAFASASERERLVRWFGALSSDEVRDIASSLPAPGASDDYPFSSITGNSRLRAMLFFDQSSWLPDNLLERGDRMTMAASLESRMPFLAPEIVESVSALPDRCRVRGWQGKWLLHQAMREVLPREVIERPKAGFRMPLAQWFRTTMRAFVTDHLLAHDAKLAAFVDRDRVAAYVAQHLDGARDHQKLVWMLLALEVWLRQLQPAARGFPPRVETVRRPRATAEPLRTDAAAGRSELP